ncbi:MAG: STAS domain-containing protein [Acidimicrobiia bacterium]|nr:STAS domain-containing protein [Acidimicrobiia bacterium]NNL28958.1 STAS domain-containing protein [Acidimicrobiia bacterium]
MALPRLNVTTSDHQGAALVHIDGEIDLSTAPQLERELANTLDSRNLIVDLRDVEFMDSTGIGVLVRTSRKVTADGRTMQLVCAAGPVKRVIEVSGLESVIDVVEDLDRTTSA